MPNRRKLTQEQREQLYEVTCRCFKKHKRRKEAVSAVKEELYGLGWEQILIEIAVSLIVKWIVDWIIKRLVDPPEKMPESFGVEGDE